MKIRNSTVIRIFSRVWKHRLKDSWNGKPIHVIAVTGWRSCLCDSSRGRERIEFLFWWDK